MGSWLLVLLVLFGSLATRAIGGNHSVPVMHANGNGFGGPIDPRDPDGGSQESDEDRRKSGGNDPVPEGL
jgi:hypothetical protein